MGMDGSWWASRTSTPAPGANTVRGGFDSHTFPPSSPAADSDPNPSAGGTRRGPAVFFDRDGTLIELIDYLHDPGRVRLLPGACSGLSNLRRAGFALVVVSNQSGIGRALFDDEARRAVDRRMSELLGAARPDLILCCPHAPGGEAAACTCRKPETGMIREAEQRLGLDLGRSYLVGDSPADIECGRRAGLRTVRVASGYGGAISDPHDYDFPIPPATHRALDLDAAAA